ncbi:hypothetical protein [Bordetella sp. 2513F-2]
MSERQVAGTAAFPKFMSVLQAVADAPARPRRSLAAGPAGGSPNPINP